VLDQTTRATVLKLRRLGHSIGAIAKTLRISRGSVKKILRAGTEQVPALERAEKAEPHEELIRERLAECEGNLVRVHEDLVASGAEISYQALTGYCRRHGIGKPPKPPAGRYLFEPGQEMQHDTSPHRAIIGGVRQKVQSASLVLGYSRWMFFQAYPRFTRFECKLFLRDAVVDIGGSCDDCMIDNTHVIVASGTGAEMVPAPEMAAFSSRLGFRFVAHEKGDANRSAGVERSMDFIERNFYAGRRFTDFADLNRQARDWCHRQNGRWRRHLQASPRELLVAERPRLNPLPIHVPEVYLLHHRIADVEGFVSVDRHRYSVPAALIGRRVEVRQTQDQIEVFNGPRLVATHARVTANRPARVLLPEHRVTRPRRKHEPTAEERALLAIGDEVGRYVALIKKRVPPLRATLTLRRLLALIQEYPKDAVHEAITTATHYGLVDPERLEGLILRAIRDEYFVFPSEEPDDEET
jgi:transposase